MNNLPKLDEEYLHAQDNALHFIQWFVLSELQLCPTRASYSAVKKRLSKFFSKNKTYSYCSYGLSLIANVQRDKFGTCIFSTKVPRFDRFIDRPLRKAKPHPKFKLITNPSFAPKDNISEDLYR